MMSKKRGVVLYLHMHQPWRVREYSVFDIADRHDYFDNFDDKYRSNRFIFEKVADKSYRPMLALLRKLLAAYPDFLRRTPSVPFIRVIRVFRVSVPLSMITQGTRYNRAGPAGNPPSRFGRLSYRFPSALP